MQQPVCREKLLDPLNLPVHSNPHIFDFNWGWSTGAPWVGDIKRKMFSLRYQKRCEVSFWLWQWPPPILTPLSRIIKSLSMITYHHNFCRGLSAIKTLCNCVCFGYIEEISLFMLFPRGFLRHCSLAMNMEKELI